MKEELKNFFSSNWKIVTIFLFGTLFDATSTVLAKMKPGTEELNPISAILLQSEPALYTIGLLSMIPMLLLALIIGLWVRASSKDYYETTLEGAGIIQIGAGINNTLILTGHPTPFTLLALAALAGHYATRLHIIWKRDKEVKSLRERVPTNPF